MTMRSMMREEGKSPGMSVSSNSFKSIGLFLSLLLIVPLVAFSIVQLNGPEIRQNAFDSLAAISRLKAEQIESWLAERRIDLEFLSSDEGFSRHAERLALTGNGDSRAYVLRRLEAYSKSGYYHSAILLNASGQVLATAGGLDDTSDPATQQLLQSALKSGQIMHSDLYRDARSGYIHLEYVLPLRGSGGRPAAAVVLHIPAKDFLFPLIQTWPTASVSAETLLVRRDGNDALFINELRHRRGSALSLRVPLAASGLPAAAAIANGKAQTMAGVDYRGVNVFAAMRPIAGTPWFLVAKIDHEEVMAPLKELIFWVSLLTFVAVVAIAMAIWRLWRQGLHRQQMELAAQATALQEENNAKYRRLHESMMDAYVMVDMAGHLLEFNSAYREMLGYSDEELKNLTYIDLTPEKWRDIEARIVAEQIIPHAQSQVYEKEYIRKDGVVIPVELRSFLLCDENGQPEVMWAVVRDITERKQAENELRIAATAFKCQEGMTVTDANRLILRVNPSFTHITGYTAEEVIGRNPRLLKSGRQDEAFYQAMWASIDNSGGWSGEVWNKRKNGEIFPESLNITAVKDANGSVTNYVALFKDITERKQAEALLVESEQHFRTLANNGSTLIWTSGQDKLCNYFNEPWLRFTGRSLEQELGNGWAEGVHPDDFERCLETYVSAFDQRKPFSIDYRLRHAEGSYRWIRDDGNPRYDSQGKFLGYIGFCVDITQQKEASAELERYRHHLESLVEDRTRELAISRDAAESANRAKNAFLANMSHELRTPLNAIIGFSDMLYRDAEFSGVQKDALAVIHKSGGHLLELINDVLDIAKIEAGYAAQELEPFDFSGMVFDVAEMLRIRAHAKGLQLRVDCSSEFPHYVVSDEAKLRQILINLMSNAIKATEEGGVILRLKLEHNKADHLLMEVEDSGVGIAPADQARIFESFVQLGAPGKEQGSGLGLAITRQFVELMGGSLTLTSTVGHGSTFRVSLPVRLPSPDEIPPPPRVAGKVVGLAPGQPAYRVLVVEDQLDNRLLLGGLLERVGFQVRLAEDGADAVEQFASWQPHFIWMDWQMPVMDGVAATRRIRAMTGGDAVKIVLVSAFTSKEDDMAMRAAGFDDIIHKPFQSELAFACMDRLLGGCFERVQAESVSVPELSSTSLAALPAPLFQELAQALLLLDGERIMAVIDEVAKADPELGAALRGRARNYDYGPILDLLQAAPFATGEGEMPR